MSSKKVVCYSLDGCQSRRVTNLALLQVEPPEAGVWLNLRDGSALRTFSSELLVKHSCRATGDGVDWKAPSKAGAAQTIIKWENADYDALNMRDRRNVSDAIKAQLSPSQKTMMHSLALSRGSLIATIIWKHDIGLFELQILDAEIRESLDFATVSRSSEAALGVPTMTSVVNDDDPVETSPDGVQTLLPSFDDVRRVS